MEITPLSVLILRRIRRRIYNNILIVYTPCSARRCYVFRFSLPYLNLQLWRRDANNRARVVFIIIIIFLFNNQPLKYHLGRGNVVINVFSPYPLKTICLIIHRLCYLTHTGLS